ncbi:hypothetical protein Pmani_008998 [Petrolisthes manimaculis]|uniref:Centromere protein Cenp-F N-terminal domain-containing protein n=1 Tax=Petrolisthes manimaculis TaxID=1843537 RepID=A0AAE1Q5Y4_9EUCA|nr:hypothetical protein Pmani_008998 [Petrolisthes manimaculis]
MSWFGSASEWKEGLSSSALSKVEELENQVERMKRERIQKQNQLETLQQALDNQKRKGHQPLSTITSGSAEDKGFWGNFGEKSNSSGRWNQRTPSKTPVKTAIETSQENPFRAPLQAPQKKGK